MSEQSTKVVVEGYLPPGHRPAPGPRPEREVWTGEDREQAQPVTESELWTAQTPIVTAPPRTAPPPPRQGAVVRNLPSADGRRTRRRIAGVDVTRGFALLGMIAVHTLPASADAAGNPTWTWSLFGGNAAALFAVLAGVSLAFLTGGRAPRRGRDAARSRVSLAVRALLLFAVGLSLNFLDIPAYNILIYYGLMFLLAIPFTLMSVRWLLVSALTFAVASPFLMQWSLEHIPAHVHANPNLFDLVNEPATVLAELFLTGTYPALPWMTFICLGMALGRLPLTRDRIQVLLVVIGAVVAAVGKGISLLMLYRFDLEYALIEATPWMTSDDVWTAQVYGPDPQLPTTTWQWLLLSGPHTNTPFALIGAAGLAMVALGGFLIASRAIGRWFTPLAAMGSMTLTLYASHLVFLTFVEVTPMPWFWYVVQIAVAALVATAWQQALGNGPLERVVTRASKAVGRAVVRTPKES